MIDTHVHFWNFDPVRDSWINADMAVIQRDFLPADLQRADPEHKLEGCIAVQASQSEAENVFLLDLASKNKLIKGIVGWVDLCHPLLGEHLGYWKNFPLIKGWRHVLQAENEDFILAKSFIDGLRQLREHGYSYDLLCYHDQLPSMIRLVDLVPGQSFILDHCGKPNIKSGNMAAWADNISILAQNQNVCCKLSGLLTEADWQNWTEKQIFDCFDVVFNQFGLDRILFASDWPVLTLSRSYQQWIGLVKKYLEQFSTDEQHKILRDNAIRCYRLDLTTSA
ncbi:MAG: amidohydrolase family protein [Pedobacter sp.]|nr:amidohydrolase family protein [Pedobacter sp.]MDQ8051675.1 amidohydrolase family protein [Pedobacter sp.]